MKMNTEKPNVIRSAFALLLAFAVVFSSIFTVAAAAQSGNTSSYMLSTKCLTAICL